VRDDPVRSGPVEGIIGDSSARRAREDREARDLERLNRVAAELNQEMEDVLRYQAEP
jgi:hypothetical protein